MCESKTFSYQKSIYGYFKTLFGNILTSLPYTKTINLILIFQPATTSASFSPLFPYTKKSRNSSNPLITVVAYGSTRPYHLRVMRIYWSFVWDIVFWFELVGDVDIIGVELFCFGVFCCGILPLIVHFQNFRLFFTTCFVEKYADTIWIQLGYSLDTAWIHENLSIKIRKQFRPRSIPGLLSLFLFIDSFITLHTPANILYNTFLQLLF